MAFLQDATVSGVNRMALTLPSLAIISVANQISRALRSFDARHVVDWPPPRSLGRFYATLAGQTSDVHPRLPDSSPSSARNSAAPSDPSSQTGTEAAQARTFARLRALQRKPQRGRRSWIRYLPRSMLRELEKEGPGRMDGAVDSDARVYREHSGLA
ncbi:hypothetical protein KM043_000509 [Ampulex compressa]|nr:hypothetical protein KM043_000509 [Ampulex compressa]